MPLRLTLQVKCGVQIKYFARVMRRSRLGEPKLAHDMATEGWMKLLRRDDHGESNASSRDRFGVGVQDEA
jgi:hypothetical protein